MSRISYMDIIPTYTGFANYGIIWSTNYDKPAYKKLAKRILVEENVLNLVHA